MNVILGAYKGAANTGTDAVHANWVRSSGFSATVAHAPGTNAESDRGMVSLIVKSPPLDGAT